MSRTMRARPSSGCDGPAAAQGFYEFLTSNITTEEMAPSRTYYGDDFCVIEHEWSGAVPGAFLGIPGRGRRISFRMLHVWEFRDGKISRGNVWLDGAAIREQLDGPEPSHRIDERQKAFDQAAAVAARGHAPA